MAELIKAMEGMKRACPDHYFIIFPEKLRIEEFPEDEMLKAGWVRVGRIETNEAEIVKSDIEHDYPNRGTGRGDGKG